MAGVAETVRVPGRGRGLRWRGRALIPALALAIVFLAGAAVFGAARVLDVADGLTTAAGREDAAIREEIRAALRRGAPNTANNAVMVSVEGGQVTLTGAVETYAQREAAADVVRRAAGAMLVDNQLQVRPAGEVTDRELQRRVVVGLELQRLTADAEISVAVAGGVAEIRGRVRSLAAKRAAGEVAASLAGIREVRNQLVVEPPAIRMDDEIADDMRASLLAHPVLRDQPITARVEGGVVILSGTVRNPTSIELAGEIAIFTRGVRDLDNRIVVRR